MTRDTRSTEGEQARWDASMEHTAIKVGDIMSGTGYVLAKNCRLVLVNGDFRYDTVPTVKTVDDMFEITGNLDAFDEWGNVLAEAPGLDEDEIKRLYLGIGAARAELGLVGNKSVHKKSEFKASQRSAIMSRALRLQELFLSRDGLRMHAKDFEEKHEIWGLEDMVAQQLSAEQVLRINQLRYGLAVSIYALNVDTATDNDITDCFAQHLKSDIENREETLYEFLQSFAGNDFDQVSSKQEKIQAYSFPELLFAGTMPMDLFEVLE